MLPLGDRKWETVKGGYRTPYDPRPLLLRLEMGEDAWDEIWENLHHQGDVGEASYAAVPHLVRIFAASGRRDWNFYGFVATLEIERHRKKNPPLPEWLQDSYRAAWGQICDLAMRDWKASSDPFLMQQALAAIALAKGQLKLGLVLAHSDESEIDRWVEENVGWSELYSSEP